MALRSVNPTNGETLATFPEFTADQIESQLARASSTFHFWRHSDMLERAKILRRAAKILSEEKQKWAQLITLEMGKTLISAVGEVEKCALACNYYADHAPAFLAVERIETEADSSIRYLPIGLVLAIMPWNFPFWQVFRFLSPALMAGNVCMLKHASNVPQCALAIEEILTRAGAPAGAFQSLLIGSNKVAGLIRDTRVAAVTLTGSEAAGMQVAATAGSVLKKCVLELGGNDPFIVLPSADIDLAVSTGVKARMAANGQSCVCAKRFIVHEDVYDAFETKFTAAVKALKVGDPMRPEVDVGPLATPDAVDTVERQVTQSIEKGARLIVGGKRMSGNGNYYMPTIIADIPPDASVYREEVFAPVAMLFKVRSLDHALGLANDTPFGLGSSVWTNIPAEQERCAVEIEAGQTFINAMVASDPRLPFGGIKQSGFGRELGALGLREFTNIKTISITKAGGR
jgi:succinate-semialdehyde dehydrogenase/glutarate-semialdehyde dehydrogenase